MCLGSCKDFQRTEDRLLLCPALLPSIKLHKRSGRLKPIVSCVSDCRLELVSTTMKGEETIQL